MSLQTIIDNATFLTVDKRKLVGSSISRSGHYKTSERSAAPYSFTVGMHAGLTYSTNRDLLEDLDSTDRIEEANISLNNNSNMQYLTNYQGSLSSAQQDQLDCLGNSGANLYIDFSNVTGNTSGYTHFFKKGDYIQPEGNTATYRYPYQVTSDIAYTSSGNSNITVPVHRPVLSQTGVSITGSDPLRIGNEVRFHVKALEMPTYNIIPHDLIQFNGDFVLIEVIT